MEAVSAVGRVAVAALGTALVVVRDAVLAGAAVGAVAALVAALRAVLRGVVALLARLLALGPRHLARVLLLEPRGLRLLLRALAAFLGVLLVRVRALLRGRGLLRLLLGALARFVGVLGPAGTGDEGAGGGVGPRAEERVPDDAGHGAGDRGDVAEGPDGGCGGCCGKQGDGGEDGALLHFGGLGVREDLG